MTEEGRKRYYKDDGTYTLRGLMNRKALRDQYGESKKLSQIADRQITRGKMMTAAALGVVAAATAAGVAYKVTDSAKTKEAANLRRAKQMQDYRDGLAKGTPVRRTNAPMLESPSARQYRERLERGKQNLRDIGFIINPDGSLTIDSEKFDPTKSLMF